MDTREDLARLEFAERSVLKTERFVARPTPLSSEAPLGPVETMAVFFDEPSVPAFDIFYETIFIWFEIVPSD